jgi:hypothetical protein
MSFKIETYNQYKLDKNKKYNLCPICSHSRSPKNQKQRCLMTNWERGLATCQHCSTVLQLHAFKGTKNNYSYFVPETKKAKPEGSFHSIEFLNQVSFKNSGESNFSKYLEGFFTRKQIFEAEQKLMILSTDVFYKKSICYPYINEKEKITGIKIMAYDKAGNRRRNKTGNGIVNWMHSIHKIENWTNDFCLFGLHQIKERSEKSVHIVESEKTAFIMTIVKPEFIWLASGGLTMLTKEKLEPLKHLKIVLHPDKGKAFSIWKQYALKRKELDIVVSSITKNNPYITDKGDLADYYLKELKEIKPAENIKKKKGAYSEAEQDETRSEIIYTSESIEIHQKRIELKTITLANNIPKEDSYRAIQYFANNETDTYNLQKVELNRAKSGYLLYFFYSDFC